MNFWMRRPIGRNLAGIFMVAGGWLGCFLLLDAAATPDAIDVLVRRGALLLVLLLPILVTTRFYDRMPLAWAGLGVHRWMGRELLLGAGIGLAMAALAWLPLALSGIVIVNTDSRSDPYLYWSAYFIVSAAVEELLFRGYVFQRLVEMIGAVGAMLLASAGFAVAHASNPEIGAMGMINIFLGGVLFSLAYLRTGSLWLPIALHALWNMSHAELFGLPVSGLTFGPSLLWTTSDLPDIVSGGAFGPEGGLVGTLALVAATAAVALIPAVEYSPYVHARVFWGRVRGTKYGVRGTEYEIGE